ncbi:MAG: hypothetical protein AAGD13_20735 [Pseudomonadota bacterium]
MRWRRLRRPTTQLARAGERTCILTVDREVPLVRFRATTLQGEPAGRVEVETGSKDAPVLNVRDLAGEVEIDGDALVQISIVPERDTAITFLPVNTPTSPVWFAVGTVLVLGASLWTAWDFFGAG